MQVTSRTTGPGRRPRGAGGFSLIELLVAFAIFALAIGSLLAALSGASQLARLTDDYNRATLLAESLLAAIVADPEFEGEQSGETDGRFRWRLRAEPYTAFDTGQAEMAVRPLWVTAGIHWGEGDESRSVVLETLHLAPPLR